MFEKLSRSWLLIKASASVLRQDKELLVFPLVSSLAALLVTAAFIAPIFGFAAGDGLDRLGRLGEDDPLVQAAIFGYGFLFYLCQYFVIFFFNTALVGAAMIRLEGGDPTVADGLRIAGAVGVILGYAAIAATVGMMLRAARSAPARSAVDRRPAWAWPGTWAPSWWCRSWSPATSARSTR
jgi:hypothetical protein